MELSSLPTNLQMISIYQQLRNISRIYKILIQTQLKACIFQSPSHIWKSLDFHTKLIKTLYSLTLLKAFSRKLTSSMVSCWPQNLMSSKCLLNQTWWWSGWTSGIPRVVLWWRISSIVTSTSDVSSLPSKIPIWIQVFHNARTVGNGDIWHLVVVLISPGALSAMELIQLNITERKHGVV